MENYDSRDLQERIEELETIKEDNNLTNEEKEELEALEELKEECENMGWDDGIYFIHEYNFEDYAEELFDECYLYELPENLRSYIDYEKFARDLKFDYSIVTFQGEDYFYREA